jgi:hypothetical protein
LNGTLLSTIVLIYSTQAFLPESPRWLLLYHWRKAVLSFRAATNTKHDIIASHHQKELVRRLLESSTAASPPHQLVPTPDPSTSLSLPPSYSITLQPGHPLSMLPWQEYRAYTDSAGFMNVHARAPPEVIHPVTIKHQEEQQQHQRLEQEEQEVLGAGGSETDVVECGPCLLVIRDDEYQHCNQAAVAAGGETSEMTAAEELRWRWLWQQQGLSPDLPAADARAQDAVDPLEIPGGSGGLSDMFEAQGLFSTGLTSTSCGPGLIEGYRAEEAAHSTDKYDTWSVRRRAGAPPESATGLTVEAAEASFSDRLNAASATRDSLGVSSPAPRTVGTLHSTVAADEALPLSYQGTLPDDELTPQQHFLFSELHSESASLKTPMMPHPTSRQSSRRLPSFGASSSSSAPARWRNPPGPGPAKARQALSRAWGRRATENPMLVEREMAKMTVSAREASLCGRLSLMNMYC